MEYGKVMFERASEKSVCDRLRDQCGMSGFAIQEDAESRDGVDSLARGNQFHRERQLKGTGHPVHLDLSAGAYGAQFRFEM